jgi:hypothetical protein
VASGHDAPLMAALRPQVSCTRCQMGTRSHEHPPYCRASAAAFRLTLEAPLPVVWSVESSAEALL